MIVKEKITYTFVSKDWSFPNVEVSLNDILNIKYMNKACHESIKGRVIEVVLPKGSKDKDSDESFIILDSSTNFNSNIVKIKVSEIIYIETLSDKDIEE